jgi:hypothetical protein
VARRASRYTQKQKHVRSAAAALLAAAIGTATSVASALALVPRVRLVDALTVLATAFGSGAALVWAIVEFRRARRS